jgi:hypothetical protein
MYVVGMGLGFTMQIIVTVVQNAVERRHMGVATSTVTFFRAMGGTFGAAVCGAILTSRLGVHLSEQFGSTSGATSDPGALANDVTAIKQLPEPAHGMVLKAFAESLHDVFLWVTPAVVLALVVAFFIKELPLKSRAAAPETDAAAAEAASASVH